MWNCQFCETEVSESSDYCPTCEYAGCTKNEHFCCDKAFGEVTMEAFTPSEIADDGYIGFW